MTSDTYRGLVAVLRARAAGDSPADQNTFAMVHGWARRRLEAQGMPAEQAQDKVADDVFDGRVVRDFAELCAEHPRGAGYARFQVRHGAMAYAAGEHRIGWVGADGRVEPEERGYGQYRGDWAVV